MTRRSTLVILALAVIALGLLVVLSNGLSRGPGSASARPGATAPVGASDADEPDGSSVATLSSPAVAPSQGSASGPPSPSPSPSPLPTASPTPSAQPNPTDGPDATLDPRVAYAAFLVELDEARTEGADLNGRLLVAAEAGDTAMVRSTALDILAFADRERDWLAASPPARCYRGAHRAARDLIEAYATVAERSIEWADADNGLDRLAALARVGVAGDGARTALDALVTALGKVTCLD